MVWHETRPLGLPGLGPQTSLLQCEIWPRSTFWYRLVGNWSPTTRGGLPVRAWPGTIQVSRSRVNAFYSYIIFLTTSIYYYFIVLSAGVPVLYFHIIIIIKGHSLRRACLSLLYFHIRYIIIERHSGINPIPPTVIHQD